MKRIYTPAKKKTILIVDDDRVAVHMYQETFQSHGYKVEVAGNDHSAMQRLKKDSIDLVIFDLCLPGINGVEVLENIRSEFDIQVLPVIVFSNAYLGTLGRAALVAGATKCVTKSACQPDQMLELVRELLAVGRSNAVGATTEVVDSNASGILAPQSQQEFPEALVATFRINAPTTLAKLRASHQAFARAEQEDAWRRELLEMHREVRALAAAELLGFQKIGRMANALEALLIELQAKPKKITSSVIRTLAQAIDTLASLFDHTPAPQTEVLAPARILVVDDEIISREIICSALEKAGFRAVSLDGSLSARHLLEQEQFDLIFLDVEMPGESGLDLCVNIREMATNRATPVVFVTAHSDFASRAQSTLSGGNDFIAKPFLLVELALKALTWLFKQHSESASTATAQDSAPKASSHASQVATGLVTPRDTGEEALQLLVCGPHLTAPLFTTLGLHKE